MPRYDALRQSSQQADQMTAASLPYVERAGGANVGQVFTQAARGTQDVFAGMQEMQIRQQEAAIHATQAEMAAQDHAIRYQMLSAEADLRAKLAPVQLMEAQTRLGVLQTQKQIREMEAEDAGYQRNFRVIGGEGEEQVYHNGRFVPYDESNPMMREAVMRRRMELGKQSIAFDEAATDIRLKRSQAIKNLREPEATGSTARAGVMRTYKEMFEEYSRQAADDRLGDDQREKARSNAAYYESQIRGMSESGQSRDYGIDPGVVGAVADEFGADRATTERVLSGIGDIYGYSPQDIQTLLLMGGPEADQLRRLLSQRLGRK